MARPKKINKKEKELLGVEEVFRLIKKHPACKECKVANRNQIRAIFKAYADYVLLGTEKNLRVSLPYIGQFYCTKQKGWEGGYQTFRKDFADKDSEYRKYYDPKPDYQILKLDIDKSVNERVKEDTSIPFTEEELIEAKKLADLKEYGEINE